MQSCNVWQSDRKYIYLTYRIGGKISKYKLYKAVVGMFTIQKRDTH